MNSLTNALSPYLKAHSSNPVNWYEYGNEPFELAKRLDLPVFISIGYLSCHWCHVMAHESFEDQKTADYLNEHFVSIKIDREERPDLDSIYMEATIELTGSGGWPMTVFCFADGRPFFAGTYFPNKKIGSQVTFMELLTNITKFFNEERNKLSDIAYALTQNLTTKINPPNKMLNFDLSKLINLENSEKKAYLEISEQIKSSFDVTFGGFHKSPKFPNPLSLELVLRTYIKTGDQELKTFIITTLNAMASGGLYDHLLGGFSRYCVDRTWTVPHFEKMLYDQPGLIKNYLHAYQLTKNDAYRQIVKNTISWIFEYMSGNSSEVYSAIDADSNKKEGDSMIFSYREIQEILSEKELFESAVSWWELTEAGNFEGKNILRRPFGKLPFPEPDAITRAKHLLLKRRLEKPQPEVDKKVVLEWNAMFVTSLLEAGFILDEDSYRSKALSNLDFLLENFKDESGHYRRALIDGQLFKALATATDLGWLTEACIKAYEYTGNSKYLNKSCEITDYIINYFMDPSDYKKDNARTNDTVDKIVEDSGKLQSLLDADIVEIRQANRLQTGLIATPYSYYDSVIPSATSVIALALIKLNCITEDENYKHLAIKIAMPYYNLGLKYPLAFSHLISAISFIQNPFEARLATYSRSLANVFRDVYIPNLIFVYKDKNSSSLSLGLNEPDRELSVEICTNNICHSPVKGVEDLKQLLLKLAKIEIS